MVRIPKRMGIPVFAFAIGAALAAENVRDSASLEVLPSRRATQFLVRNETPVYPSIAKMNYIQGKVSVQATVNDAGRVEEAHVVKGHPFLAVAALKAIRNWVFKPAHSRRGPAYFVTYVDVKFSLHTRRLTPLPPRPEDDLDRQVRPPTPEVMPSDPGAGESVRVRVLVGEDGRALDSFPLEGSDEIRREARRVLAAWTFRPARWGALAVPWYIEVEVPVSSSPRVISGALQGEPPVGSPPTR
jgi:TonB family protein